MNLIDVRIDREAIALGPDGLSLHGITNLGCGVTLDSINLRPPSAAPGREIELIYAIPDEFQGAAEHFVVGGVIESGLSVLAHRERPNRRTRTDEGRTGDAAERTRRIT